MESKIEIANLTKIFTSRGARVVAIDNLTLSIPRGQFVCIVGPSGCGKTTLLRILAGLERKTEGHVRVTQDDPTKSTNSMIFQEQSIFPWMSVWDNTAFGLAMRGVPRSTYAPIVDGYLRKVGLSSFAKFFPHQLSGGMKQRVSIARAFANDPEVLLMDEPFASLDEQNKILLQEELLRIWDETRKTVVFITHSIDEALVLGDRVIVMTAQPGRIKADLAINFPRPREVYKLKAQPEFGRIGYQVWDYLKEEVMRAKEADEEVASTRAPTAIPM